MSGAESSDDPRAAFVSSTTKRFEGCSSSKPLSRACTAERQRRGMPATHRADYGCASQAGRGHQDQAKATRPSLAAIGSMLSSIRNCSSSLGS